MTAAAAADDPATRAVSFIGADGNVLRGDVRGDGPLTLLLHGGGQTRQSWDRTARHLAAIGHRALTLDLRGHGDSDWSPDGHYTLHATAADLSAVLLTLDERPALVGASMGGLCSMLALAAEPDGGAASARCLVLVDVAPRMELEGLQRIRAFMQAAPDGFASVDAAADAVAAYLPGRRRTTASGGLLRNLRLRADGRYHWHWDPRVLADLPTEADHRHDILTAAAAAVRVPTMLVRGGRSDVVSEQGVHELLELIPGAVVAEIGGAGHMVAGDDNDDFTAAVAAFVGAR